MSAPSRTCSGRGRPDRITHDVADARSAERVTDGVTGCATDDSWRQPEAAGGGPVNVLVGPVLGQPAIDKSVKG